MIVVDTTAPALDLPDNLVTEATGPAGALVDFAASAVDLVSGSTPATCTPATGSSFPIGATEVTCRSTDGADNTTSGLFLVTVADTTPPALTVPEAISISASSPDGARVDYYVTAVDTVNGLVPVTGDPPSGSLFPVGTTTVTCTASDRRRPLCAGGQSGRVSRLLGRRWRPSKSPCWPTLHPPRRQAPRRRRPSPRRRRR